MGIASTFIGAYHGFIRMRGNFGRKVKLYSLNFRETAIVRQVYPSLRRSFYVQLPRTTAEADNSWV